MVYKATCTKFTRVSGKIVPTMEKSDRLGSKTALKTFIGDQIDAADEDSDLINIQFLVRRVDE